jgi:mannose-6-phosphate isomerase-like protein (cupin superfamily)
MGWNRSSLDELGDGYGFRKVRAPLGVTAFGCNFLVYPPGYDGIGHYHDTQDELYLVHKGRARFDVDGETFDLEEGGVVHVESTTPRRVSNPGDVDLVLLIVGGKDGYVQRDGHVISEEDGERRRAMSEGSMDR